MPLEKLCLLQPTLEDHWRDCNSPHTHSHIYLGRVAATPFCYNNMVVQQAASGQVSVNSALSWSVLFCIAYQFCGSNMWVLQHYSVLFRVVGVRLVVVDACVNPSCLFSYPCKMSRTYAGLYNALSLQDPVTERVLSCTMDGVSWHWGDVLKCMAEGQHRAGMTS